MQKPKDEIELENILNTIIEAIRIKKGQDIIDLDLTQLNTSVTRHFIICHANSHIQAKSIAEGIEELMLNKLAIKPYHKEGLQNSFWILLDYQDVIVHVFQAEYRSFYKLEELWADGDLTSYES